MSSTGAAIVGIIGASWRAQYFLRAARELPDQFTVKQVLVRSDDSAARVTRDWGVPSTTSAADFLNEKPYDYVVVAAPPSVANELILKVVSAGIPVLSETPPAPDAQSLFDLYKRVGGSPVQVAEQYQYQPHHAARFGVARAGVIGDVTNVRVSVAHGYHGVSLIRLALGAGFEPAEISANTITDRVASPRGRDAWKEPTEYDSVRTTALLRFGQKSGAYEFDAEQYSSPIRSRSIHFFGSRGEIDNDQVSYLAGPDHAAHVSLHREATGIDGDLEGFFLHRISLGEDVYYDNRFSQARLNDDELAVAEVMHRMTEFVRTGTEFYGLADASHDQYLSLLINEATETTGVLRTGETPWSSAVSFAHKETGVDVCR